MNYGPGKRENLISQASVNLQALRWNKGLTQTQLAELAGMPQGKLSALERGTLCPTPQLLKKLADVLECKVSDIIDFSKLVDSHAKKSRTDPRAVRGTPIPTSPQLHRFRKKDHQTKTD